MASTGGSAELRAQLLAALEGAQGPLTTSELRDHVVRHGDSNTVIEAVYRNLTVLQRRGEVERSPGPGRGAYWVAAVTRRSAQDRPA